MKKNTLMLKLFVTYVLVLILPLTSVTIALCDRLFSSYQAQASQRIENALETVDNVNSTWRSFIERLSIVIALDEKTRELGSATDRVDRIFEGISYMAV